MRRNLINIRKSIASLLSVGIIIFLVILTVDYRGQPIPQIIFISLTVVFIGLISTDYKVLKVGIFGKVYFYLQEPEIQQKEKEGLENLMQKLKIDYFTKQYHLTTKNRPLKVAEIDGNIAYVDSGSAFTNLKRQLTFALRQQKTIKMHARKMLKCYDPPIGTGIVKEVGEDLTTLDIRWAENNAAKDVLKELKLKSLKGLNIFALIEIDEDIESSDIEDLKKAYESVKKVYVSKYGVE